VSVRLLMLGLLRNGSLHGYEIKRIIETEMGDWANVAAGSIYFALDKLASDALIEEKEISQDGGRPARTIYGITAAGRAEFERLLRETWGTIDRQSFPLDIGVAFMESLSREELRSFLEGRVRTLEGILSGLQEHQKEIERNTEVPTQARFIFSHHRRHYQAELEWTREVLGSL
jgi:DNA-binding PadR family transcriptional regulator